MPPKTSELLLEYGEENPLIAHYNTTGDGSALRFSDFVTRDELHDTHLYQELYRAMGIEYQMSVTLPAQAPMIFALVVADHDRDFSERDRAVLNRIRPHLAQLWRNVRDLDLLRALVSTAQDGLARPGVGRDHALGHPRGAHAGRVRDPLPSLRQTLGALALPGPGRAVAVRPAGGGGPRRRADSAAPALGPGGRRPAASSCGTCPPAARIPMPSRSAYRWPPVPATSSHCA